MTEPRPNPVWAELVQLVPVVLLASSFLVTGDLDLARAGPLFLLAAALTVPITLLVAWRGHVANPILVGAALWLWVGAIAFNVPVPSVADWIAETRAVGLFAAAFVVGVVTTRASPTGYVGVRHPDPAWIRRASAVMLVLTLLAVSWSWNYRDKIRLGGGLPFIALHVARRLVIRHGALHRHHL